MSFRTVCDCEPPSYYDSYDYSTDDSWYDGRTDLREDIVYSLRKLREDYLTGDEDMTALEIIEKSIEIASNS
jgi:hypothetical protein